VIGAMIMVRTEQEEKCGQNLAFKFPLILLKKSAAYHPLFMGSGYLVAATRPPLASV